MKKTVIRKRIIPMTTIKPASGAVIVVEVDTIISVMLKY